MFLIAGVCDFLRLLMLCLHRFTQKSSTSSSLRSLWIDGIKNLPTAEKQVGKYFVQTWSWLRGWRSLQMTSRRLTPPPNQRKRRTEGRDAAGRWAKSCPTRPSPPEEPDRTTSDSSLNTHTHTSYSSCQYHS